MRKGFTLIELMIVIAIIAIIAAIAIPNLLESRITSNESAAATSLKSGVHPAQVQFQGGNYADDPLTAAGLDIRTPGAGINGNGIGDFAFMFNQLCGGNPLTGGAPAAAPAITLSLLPITWLDRTTSTVAAAPVYGIVTGGAITGPNINNYVFFMASSNETGFIVTCAPSDGVDSIGRRRFGINAAGTVYSTGATSLNGEVDPLGGTAPFGGGAPAVAGDPPWNIPVAGVAPNLWSVHKK